MKLYPAFFIKSFSGKLYMKSYGKTLIIIFAIHSASVGNFLSEDFLP